jgi:hypothetical protein
MNTISTIKSYSELITIPNYLDRYNYLKIGGRVGAETFGYDRYLNQLLYTCKEWRNDFRPKVITRDNGCDMAHEDYQLDTDIIVHHINPITVEDVINRSTKVFDFDNVVCVSRNTHNAIHYGDVSLLVLPPVERSKNDTCPWRRGD